MKFFTGRTSTLQTKAISQINDLSLFSVMKRESAE